MDYRIVVTENAEMDLDNFVQYLLFIKQNEQAAKNLMDDFDSTLRSLESVAGSLKLCDNPRLKEEGYRRINFLEHRNFILYRVERDVVYIDSIFHELQDYESRMN